MRNWIQAGLASLVIAASLALMSIGIVRAASGYSWNTSLPRGLSLFSFGSSGMPSPMPTVEATSSAQLPHLNETESHNGSPTEMDDDSQEYSGQPEQDDDSQEYRNSQGQGDDSEYWSATPQPGHPHSGSTDHSSDGDDGGGGD